MNPTEPVRITPEALRDVVAHCTSARPNEACGFVVGVKGSPLGHRIRRMRNVDPDPTRAALMATDDVLYAYSQFDAKGEDPLIAYHSHVTSPPLMSERDKANAVDPSLAYMIVSLEGGNPRARAYRSHSAFIGVHEHREVEIIVSADGEPPAPAIPEAPWALTVGNEVRIGYTRHKQRDLATAWVRVVDVRDASIYLEPMNNRVVPKSVGLERIRTVHLLREHAAAVEMRRAMRLHARHLASALGDGDLATAGPLAAALAAAFPNTFKITMEET